MRVLYGYGPFKALPWGVSRHALVGQCLFTSSGTAGNYFYIPSVTWTSDSVREVPELRLK